MRDALHSEASADADDIHDRDTLRVTIGTEATTLPAATPPVALRACESEPESDGPPTLKVPVPIILDIDEDDTRPYTLESRPEAIRIAAPPVPRELVSLPEAPPTAGVDDDVHGKPTPAVQSDVRAMLEMSLLQGEDSPSAERASSLAPAVRSTRPEPRRATGEAVLLLAAIVPLASAALLISARLHGGAEKERHAVAAGRQVAPRVAEPAPRTQSVEAPGVTVLAAASPVVDAPSTLAVPENLRKARKRAPSESAALPEVPARADVVAALEPLREEVQTCAAGRHGVAQVDVSVSGSGAVAYTVVGGDFAGSAEGSCIARALRKARFRPFQQARFRVLYPFSI
jgi:hypothetical protein